MTIILVGLNHRTAPVAVREQLTLSGCTLEMALSDLAALPERFSQSSGIRESAILSTCNRLEVYAYATTSDPGVGFAAIESLVAGPQGQNTCDLRPYLYLLEDRAAVEHLMAVAAGLDSMILGEPQILGQVAQAHARAQAAGTAGFVLSHLFGQAIHTGKRARSESGISRFTTSISHTAAHLAKETCGDLADATVLIVGAGEMAALAAEAMWDEGVRRLTFINRTYTHAARLAEQFGGRAFQWGGLSDALVEADVIVSATGAPHTVIYRDEVAQALPHREGRLLVVIDIAMPRDVEVQVGELPGVRRYDIDHLQGTIDANRAQREAAVPQVQSIIQQEVESFLMWMAGREVVPILIELRRRAEALADLELEHTLRRLECPDPRTEHMVELLVHRIVSKLLHEPTVRLKAKAAGGDGVFYADALRELFALELTGPVIAGGSNGNGRHD